jgi:phosphoribosylaminoimidazolecarboxamide formyltransferase/IMP cyclohydrolase
VAGLTGVEHVTDIDRLGVLLSNGQETLMRYGLNPHQQATVTGGNEPRVINGEPSMTNYLDALNAFELVREAQNVTGHPAAASFKHVSPAGVAIAGEIEPTTAAIWRVIGVNPQSLLSAYVRARDADPKSSFGDVVALSRPVDMDTAQFLRTVICDAVIAPGYEPGVAGELSKKRSGRFLVLEADDQIMPPARERRDVLGVTMEQDRDSADVRAVLPNDDGLDAGGRMDALLGLVTVRYTQSNSVAFVRDGAAIGVGAGQQNRVDCVRLAGSKALTWWLRRHPFVEGLPAVSGMGRQDRLNWQIRFAGYEMTQGQLREFGTLFGSQAREQYMDHSWRDQWATELQGVTMASDGYLPFRDNVEHAAEYGVSTIVEPGGSTRTAEVAEAALSFGITHVQTGLRLFHH